MAHLDENTLTAFLGGSLVDAPLAGVEQHLDECAECRSLVAALVRGDRAAFDSFSPLPTAPSPAGQRPSLERGKQVSRYVVLEQIGHGGMGVVYSAYDPVLERKVALKLVRADAGAEALEEVKLRLLREGKSIAQLSHPNIVAVHDMGTSEEGVFIAMELVDGGSLRQWLKEHKRSWREVLEKFLAAGEGLAAAHRARLVHRDFKPENVLVGKDGRVRVTDFGLARSADAAPSPSPQLLPESPTHPWVTRSGAMLGTPAYMSPEQHAGNGAEALSDQFSFCVALWEATFGSRPYSATAASASWVLAEPPADTQVPLWIRRALHRGLKLAPEDRYPTMEELLAALSTDPGAKRRSQLRVASAIAALVLTLAASAWWLTGRNSRLCKGALAQVERTWNLGVKASIGAAFAATGRADAASQWELGQKALDAHWQAWSATRTEACEATRVRGEQSDQILGLRMACLERRSEETRALLALFGRADSEVVSKAPEAIGALTSVRGCSDVEALLAQVPGPEDPATAAKVEQARARLAESKAHFDTGQYPLAIASSTQAVAEAKALAYRPVIAEALLMLGRQQEHLGELKQSEQTLLDAITAAEAGKHDEVTAQAATHLMLVLGARQARFNEADAWGRLAEGSIGRIGGSKELQAQLLKSRGLVLYAQGKVNEAITHHQAALAILETVAPDSLRLAETLNDLGAALRGGGKASEALAAFGRALDILVKKVGADSDLIAATRNGIGNVYMLQGRFEEAFVVYQQSRQTFEKTLGPTHFRTVTALNNLGVVLAERGRYAEALPYFERVLKARQATLSPTDSKISDAHSNIAMLLVELGRHAEATTHFEHAQGILQGYPRDHFSQTEFLLGFAKIDLAKGAPDKALPVLERVLALCENRAGFRFDYTRARANFLLGQALWEGRVERRRGRQLVTAARDALIQFGRERFARDLGEIDRWLAAHGTGE